MPRKKTVQMRNMTVARFNMTIVQFPSSIPAGVHHFTAEPLFEISAAARQDADEMRISKL